MPSKVDEIHDALISDPEFYKDKDKKERDSIAWAIAWSKYKKTKKKKKKYSFNIIQNKRFSEKSYIKSAQYNNSQQTIPVNYKYYYEQISNLDNNIELDKINLKAQSDRSLNLFHKNLISQLIGMKKNNVADEKINEWLESYLKQKEGDTPETLKAKAEVLQTGLTTLSVAGFVDNARQLRNWARQDKIKLEQIAKKSPQTVINTNKFVSKVISRFPKLARFFTFPVIASIVMLYFDRQTIANYIADVNSGAFDKKWAEDAVYRKDFVVNVSLIASPFLGPVAGAIALGVGLGAPIVESVVEKVQDLTGTTASDKAVQQFNEIEIGIIPQSENVKKAALLIKDYINKYRKSTKYIMTNGMLPPWHVLIKSPTLLSDRGFKFIVSKSELPEHTPEALKQSQDFIELQQYYVKLRELVRQTDYDLFK